MSTVITQAKIGRIGGLYMELIDRKRLAKLMILNDVSQRQLASIAGWKSHTYMQRLLRGEVKTLNTDPALRIAHYFKVPVDDLFLTRVDTNPEHDVHKSSRHVA
ncbi:helix-turn-helix transcriptional regulator [Rhodococcus opacus]|uniref:helix-turn-helix transcriptional regulator n=1 Tax=Rhodococcus opacus TaxID=37919 RepID=UPI001F51B914|nr:helix-turn-helix transcriptional regulator [Rhodococcus opacus]